MLLFLILAIPATLAAGALVFKKQRVFGPVNAAGYFAVLLMSGLLFRETLVSDQALSYFGFMYVDPLSAFFIFVTSVVAFAASLYSIGYIRRDVESGLMSEKKAEP